MRKLTERIAAIIARTIAQTAKECGTDYKVANTAELDWCPCCGVNFRLYDIDGNLFAKLICMPDDAKRLGADLIRNAYEMKDFGADASVALAAAMKSMDGAADCAQARVQCPDCKRPRRQLYKPYAEGDCTCLDAKGLPRRGA